MATPLDDRVRVVAGSVSLELPAYVCNECGAKIAAAAFLEALAEQSEAR